MANPLTSVGNWLENLLLSLGLAEGFVTFILATLSVLTIMIFVLVLDVFLVWVERKVVARFQGRLGPNRLGPFGIIQPFADVIKLLIKEDITPIGADRILFNLAPPFAMAAVLLIWAVIPFSDGLLGADINVGVLYIVGVGTIGTLSIILAGWASNNKYSLLGAVRTVAQMIAYEVPMVIVLLVPVLLARSMSVSEIVDKQVVWYIFIAPLAAIILIITAIAEIGRTPFDLLEAESEIVAGFHIEYTGMKFGMFYAAELLHALTVGALFATLFLGGWRGPYADQFPILGVFYLFLKAFLIYYLIMWIKYTLPRIRIDHMMNFNWKFLTPLALALLVVTAITDKLIEQYIVGATLALYAGIMLAANVVIAWIVLSIVRKYAKSTRTRVAEEQSIAQPPIETPASGSD
jgi:NADH-quinone oxidoreductase subunit H